MKTPRRGSTRLYRTGNWSVLDPEVPLWYPNPNLSLILTPTLALTPTLTLTRCTCGTGTSVGVVPPRSWRAPLPPSAKPRARCRATGARRRRGSTLAAARRHGCCTAATRRGTTPFPSFRSEGEGEVSQVAMREGRGVR